MIQLQIKQQQQTIKIGTYDSLNQPITEYASFLQPIIFYEPDKKLLLKLKEIQNSNKAYLNYLKKLKQKSFGIIYEENYQKQLQFYEKAFLGFKNQRIQAKITKLKTKYFFCFLEIFHQQKKEKKQKQGKSINHYKKQLVKNTFKQLKNDYTINKKIKKLIQFIKLQSKEQFILHLKQNHRMKNRKKGQDNQTDKLINQFYEKNLIKKYLDNFHKATRLLKLQKKIKQINFQAFIRKIKNQIFQTFQMVEKFQNKCIDRKKRQIFDIFNQNKVQSKISERCRLNVMKKYFQNWKQSLQIILNEKQIEQSNDIILNHFLELKQPDKNLKRLTTCFSEWKNWMMHEKARKHQQHLLRSFAEIKSKQLIQRKYFLILKENRLSQKARRFNMKRLKFKVFESFKEYLIKESIKLQNYYKFVQKRSTKKYFDKIREFNNNEKQKIFGFQMKKYWAQFTLNITQGYFIKLQKAQNYYAILLKFKSVIGLKQNVQLNQKACYLAHYLNIVRPFQRWHRHQRILKFIQIKELYLMKRIFFQIKCMAIRKQNSSQRIKFEDNQQKKANPKEFPTINDNEMIISKVKELQISQQDNNFQQTSFFQQISSKIQDIKHHQILQSQEEQDDQIKKKLDSLLNRIKKQKSNQIQSTDKNFTNKRSIQKLRIPTWSTPGQQYKVSVFQDQNS